MKAKKKCIQAPLPKYFEAELHNSLRRKETDYAKQSKVDSALKRLTVEKFVIKNKAKDGDDTERECCICCMEYKKGDTRLRLPCFHVFHNECIRPWLRDKSDECPVCHISLIDALDMGKAPSW